MLTCCLLPLIVQGQVRAAPPLEPTGSRAEYEAYALTHDGDVDAGRKLFHQAETPRCSVCHVVAGQGGTIGPDLSRIGAKFDRPHLIESILEPSRQIVEGYRSSMIVTDAGRVIHGLVVRETERDLTICDSRGETISIERSQIEQRQASPLSIMPDGFHHTVSLDQFADLIAYLETLRPGGRSTPGERIAGRLILPKGFAVETVATGITGATALETLPNGDVLVCEQTGQLRHVRNGALTQELVLSLEVDSTWERGLIGVTVGPRFPDEPWVYVCYVAERPYPHHVVSRFRWDGKRCEPTTEQVLLVGDDQRQLGGNVPAGHQGGALHFGPDGHLYIAIGEQTAGLPSQDLGTLQGKLLRIASDGSIPDDNPLLQQTTGKYQAIYCLGLRNPYTFAFQPGTGRLLVNDVGGQCEEINEILPGRNYGWPTAEHGTPSSNGFTGPIHQYPQASIAGGDFLPTAATTQLWPHAMRGGYFFADFVHGWIRWLDPDRPAHAKPFLSGLSRPVDLRFASDGSLYVLLRNAWVKDDKFAAGTGSLLRIVPVSTEEAKQKPSPESRRQNVLPSLNIREEADE